MDLLLSLGSPTLTLTLASRMAGSLPLVAGERAGHVTWRRVWRVWLNSLGTRDFRNRKLHPAPVWGSRTRLPDREGL